MRWRKSSVWPAPKHRQGSYLQTIAQIVNKTLAEGSYLAHCLRMKTNFDMKRYAVEITTADRVGFDIYKAESALHAKRIARLHFENRGETVVSVKIVSVKA